MRPIIRFTFMCDNARFEGYAELLLKPLHEAVYAGAGDGEVREDCGAGAGGDA